MIDEDGDEFASVPEICPDCCGRKVTTRHVEPDGGITAEEWWGPDWDDDSREMYLNGDFDKPCPLCKGEGIVAGA